jgi:glyoxylase-like metal-dependent hydrolase (beta-lactamase superfamily II)
VAVDVVEVADQVWHARAEHVGWVMIGDGRELTLVDTGYPGDRDALAASLERIGRSATDVAAILLTHAHPDHLGNAERLRREHATPVLVHPAEAAHARGDVIEQVSVGALLRRAWRPSVLVWVLDILRLDATRVERVPGVGSLPDGPLDAPGRPVAVHTPGHTSGHCALHLPERGVVVAGDALTTAHALLRETGPQLLPDLFHTDAAEAHRSLDRLVPLAGEVVVPGHGPAFRGSPAAAVAAVREGEARRARARRRSTRN